MAYGTVAADVISTSVAGSNIGAGNASIMKNRLINSAMVIDQRNAGASVTASGYTLDRWRLSLTQTGKYSIQQNAGSVTPPAGYTYYLGATSSSAYSVLSSDQFSILQYIEGYNVADLNWGSANAKTVTLSFWVRSSLTGTFGGSILNSDNTRSYPYSYTISSANTWEQKSVTITGDTSGTWLTTTGIGIKVGFGLGAGSTLSGTAGSWASAAYFNATGATSVVGTNGATFYITGVQLEVGEQATGFEYRQYQQELALCQRYYQKVFPNAANVNFASGFCSTTTSSRYVLPFITSMRIAPTALETDGTASDYSVNVAAGAPACNSVPAFASASTAAINFTADVASGLTAGQGSILRTSAGTTAGYLAWSAEL